jgi:hypothetical protein
VTTGRTTCWGLAVPGPVTLGWGGPRLKAVPGSLGWLSGLLRHNPQALTGYYHRQVICRLASGWILLPAGYGISPAARPISLHL